MRPYRVIYLGVPSEFTSMIDALVVALRRSGVRARVFSKRMVIDRDVEQRVALNAPADVRDNWRAARERFDSLIWIRDLLNTINVASKLNDGPMVAVIAEADEDPRIPPMLDYVFDGGIIDAVCHVESKLGRKVGVE